MIKVSAVDSTVETRSYNKRQISISH